MVYAIKSFFFLQTNKVALRDGFLLLLLLLLSQLVAIFSFLLYYRYLLPLPKLDMFTLN